MGRGHDGLREDGSTEWVVDMGLQCSKWIEASHLGANTTGRFSIVFAEASFTLTTLLDYAGCSAFRREHTLFMDDEMVLHYLVIEKSLATLDTYNRVQQQQQQHCAPTTVPTDSYRLCSPVFLAFDIDQ